MSDTEIVEKPKHKYLPVLLTALVLILIGAGVAAGVWYYMDKQAKEEAVNSDKKLETLQKQYETEKDKISSDLKASIANATTESAKQVAYTDKEQIIIATIAKYNNPNFIPAVNVTKIEGNWALSTPVPLQFKQDSGYTVPGMGGTVYLWNKVGGKWIIVGSAGETGWDAAVKAKYSTIPKTIIPDSER